jgi:hypothetical protein
VSFHLLIGFAGLCAAGGFAILAKERRRARRRARRDGIEALIDATRETIPDHVPDAWVKEFRR